jgi:Fatty acid/phospholipid biosynthesis enzyme
VVTDGFVGNVMLKAVQGVAGALFFWVNQEAQQLSFMRRFLLWMNRGLFQRIKDKTDYASVGGALLLGVNHPVILAHGRSDARAICNAIVYAHYMVKEGHLEQFKKSLQELILQEYNGSRVLVQKSDASLDI